MRMRKEQLIECGDPKCNSFLMQRNHNVSTTYTQMQPKLIKKLERVENFVLKHSKNNNSEVPVAA